MLPPVIHLGHERLALNQVAIGPFNSLVIAQLLELQRFIDARNSEIMGGYTTTPLHRWGELVSTKFSQMSRDSMNRIILYNGVLLKRVAWKHFRATIGW